MRKALFFLLAMLPLTVFAQLGTFDRWTLPKADTFYVNYSQPGVDVGIDEANVHYPCVYDTAFGGLWVSGFAFSNMTDTLTKGFKNQYSAKYKRAVDTLPIQYMVANGQHNYVKTLAKGQITSLWVTNTTYAYYSMYDGDAFAKKFGGPSGNDPDWFKLTIRGYDTKGVYPSDSTEFYLADFRFADNSKDYIIHDWTPINVPFKYNQSLDSVTFNLSSSDTGMFGINTPLYFALDNVFFLQPTSVQEIPFSQIASIFPNPATNFLTLEIKSDKVKSATITDMAGRMISTFPITAQRKILNISSLPAGQYMLQLSGEEGRAATKFIKQ
ncbi:MAG: DUF4465 domain-containing protein [Chitinophagaceae bacterium]